MTTIQIPRPENAVDQNGSFKSYWLAFFSIIGKRFNAATATAPVASADAAAAPGAYNQAHIQTIVAEVNELKAQVNALLAALSN